MTTRWIPLIALAIAGPALAASVEAIPEKEQDFVDTIQTLQQSEIAELLGAPAYQYDIKDDDGQIVGSIWHYHGITTGDDGQYYKTTELDFVGNKVANIVLINDEDTDTDDSPTQPEPMYTPSSMAPANMF
jgi:hypothetical protein